MSLGPRAAASVPLRVLIVDDELRNRELLEFMLAPDGFEILHAASGEEALAMVARQLPDLILLDVLMPGLDGYEVASRLKANLITRGIPVIMVSALDAPDARLSGLSTGAEEFLSRPVNRAELSIRVRNLLRLKSTSDAAVARRDDSMGMVSHDLRGMLSGILLTASLLAEQASDSEEGQRTIEGAARIKRYVTRMDRLIGDLVDVVRIDGGKLALDARRSDAITMLREVVDGFAHAAADKCVSLDLRVVEPALVAGFDRERLLQVVSNLVSNALKFTPPGGGVVLRGERSGDGLHILVTDTGTGIPAHMIEAIFERFQQVDDNGKTGLGLGLYIARCIVESHGGRIWAESRPGHGSTLHFTIPGTIQAARDPPEGGAREAREASDMQSTASAERAP